MNFRGGLHKAIAHSTIIILSALLIISCKKDNRVQIPNVYVNINLDISSTIYIELNNVGGYVNITGGYKGITVRRNDISDFVAFERCCSYDPTVPAAIVTVDSSGLSLTCHVCGSKFLILDGSIIKGPATQPLKQYNTSFDGEILNIHN